MNAFKSPRRSLGDLPAEHAAALLGATTDIAIALDARGVVKDVSVSNRELDGLAAGGWVGRRLIDTVTPESRQKIEELLAEASGGGDARWRQVNHPAPGGGADVPVLYSAVDVGAGRSRRVVVAGRELVSVSRIQQRLIEAQNSLEKDYSRLRSVETRYRLLMQTVPEPVLVIDAATQRVLEANPAAEEGIGLVGRTLVGQIFPVGLSKAGTNEVQAMLSSLRTSGRPAQCRIAAIDDKPGWIVSGSLLRQDSNSLVLLRMAPVTGVAQTAQVKAGEALIVNALTHAADAFVLTTAQGQILDANLAFLAMCQLAHQDQVVGQRLDRWLGRQGVDLNVMTANLRQAGSVRLFSTTLQGDQGLATDVEISATTILERTGVHYAFSIRDVSRRLPLEPAAARELPKSVEQIAELVGRVALKDLVREATDAIERLCIEAALELTRDNRASAAEMLGLSRQSLYVKLRRYGLAEIAGD